MPTPPTAAQLVPHDGLDERHVLRHFLGKSRDDAFQMFLSPDNSQLTEDFMYMADAGLAYYLEPALRYLADDRSAGDWDFPTGLLCSLSHQLTSFPLSDAVKDQVRLIANRVRDHHAKFNIDLDDYILGLLARINQTPPDTDPN